MNFRTFVPVLIIGLCVPFFASAATNIVPNGDLETVSSASSARPEGWSTKKTGTNSSTFTYPVAGKAVGSKAAKVQITFRLSGDAKWAFNHIPVSNTATYQYSDAYKANVATKVTAEYKMSNGSLSTVQLGSAPSTGSNWGTFTKELKPPVGAVSLTVYHLLDRVGTLTIDNVSVVTLVPPPPKPVISSFIANPATIAMGASTQLEWVVTGASSTSINQGIGSVTGNSRQVSPTQNTIYVLTATNPGGSVTATTTVTVTQPPPAPGDNLIPNGNLENGSANSPTGWRTDFWGNLQATFTYPVTGNSAGKAARVVVTNWQSGDAKWWFDHIPALSNTRYLFSDEYTSNVSSNITLEIQMSDGSFQYQWVADVPAVSNWSTFKAEFTLPQEAVSFTVLHALNKNGSLTIDNASLVIPDTNASAFPQGMVSFTFDDSWLSQYTTALPILEAAGIKGTFYLTTEPIQMGWSGFITPTQANDYAVRGHEVGGHTVTHANLTTLTGAQLSAELVNSKNYLESLTGIAVTTLAYPYGAYNNTVKTATQNAGYTSAREIDAASLNLTTTDKFALKSLIPEINTPTSQIKAMIDNAKAQKQWLIFGLHEINNTGGQFTYTPAQLQEVVDYVTSVGIETVTIKEGRTLMAP